MSESENQEDNPAGTESQDFGDYEANIVQISDTEEKGLDYENILDQYEENDVDAFVYVGDATKKDALDHEEYLEQFDNTYEDLSNLGDELDAEVLVEPGNHEPIKGSHSKKGDPMQPTDKNYVDNVEEIMAEEYEGFSEFDGNAYEFMAEKHDLTNIEYGSVDIKDLTIIGGTHHMGQEAPREWLEDTPELEELGYDSEEVAGEIEIENSYDGLFSDVPFVGRIMDLMFGGEIEHPDPEEVSLEDIPEDYEQTIEHKQYEKALDLESHFEEMIEGAENDVFLTHHGVSSSNSQHGSVVVDKVMEDYSEDIAAVGGGHTGSSGFETYYDTPTINTNGGAVAELGFEDGGLAYSDMVIETETGSGMKESEQEQVQQRISQIAQDIPDESVNEELVEKVEENEGMDGQEAVEKAKEVMARRFMIKNQQEQAQTAAGV